MRKKNVLLLANSLILVFLLTGCGLFSSDDGTNPADRPLCVAVDKNSTQEFLDSNNTALFEQLNNDQVVFLFLSSLITGGFDGVNVIALDFAQVLFDFEDGSVDPGDLGGFYARWKIVIVPFEDALLQELENANNPFALNIVLAKFLTNESRVEVQLPGPFLETGCEWGDTDEIGTQTLTYSNYAIYDWDFFPGVDRVLAIIYEGDEGVGDDVIAWMDIFDNSGQVTVEDPSRYKIDFTAMTDVMVNP